MPFHFDISIPPADLAKAQEVLDPRQFSDAAYQAVKKTTHRLVRQIKQQVSKRLAVAQQDLDDVVREVVPSGNPPTGKVIVSKKPLAASKFKFTSLARGGVSIKIRRDQPPLILKHAFVATMKSGHVGIFYRSKFLPKNNPTVNGRPKYKLTPAGFAGRLRIEQEFAPPVINIVSLPDVLKSITFDAQQSLQQELASQISRFTKPASTPATNPEPSS